MPVRSNGVPARPKRSSAASAERYCRKDSKALSNALGKGTRKMRKPSGKASTRRVCLPRHKQQAPRKSRRREKVVQAMESTGARFKPEWRARKYPARRSRPTANGRTASLRSDSESGGKEFFLSQAK